MRSSSGPCRASLILLGLLGSTGPASAQVPAEQPSADASDITPPRLVHFVRATRPESSGQAALEVVTELTIDAEGRVTDATVVESADPTTDLAVLQAVRSFRFEPARRGGAPISVKIRYSYVLDPALPKEDLVVDAPAQEPREQAPSEPPGQTRDPLPAPTEELAEYGATAEVEAPTNAVTRRSIDEEQLTRIPGTRGDAIRAIEVMPGVARTGTSFANPLLRGAAWNESATYLDGVPVPFLFHFGGLTSFMNSRLIERVDLYPSNFATRFGRVSGGIVEVQARDPRTDGPHGVVDLNFIDSSILVEAPAGDQTAVAAAARRSNIDFFFETFVSEESYSVVAAPLYWDYQLLGTHRFGDDRLRVMGYGGRDSVQLFFSEPNDEDPGLVGDVAGTVEYHRVQLALHSRLSDTMTQDLVLMLGYSDFSMQFGQQLLSFKGPELHARAEWKAELIPELHLTTGVDVQASELSGGYRGTPPNQTEGDTSTSLPIAAQRLISLEFDDVKLLRPGGYLDLAYSPTSSLRLVPGVRVDYYDDLERWSVDPRLSARHQVGSSTVLKSGVGLYSQPPEAWQAYPGVGNPDLKPTRALHNSAGVEQEIGSAVKVGVEGFYKWLYDRVVATEGGRPPYLVNDGDGRIAGVELSAQLLLDSGAFAYGAYTLSRSERRDLDGQWRLFDYDQTHVLSLVGGYPLGSGWELGARFRLVSGDPHTPIVGSVYDAKSGVYVPVNGPINSARNPTFYQLDLRAEKVFRIGAVSLAAYLELQNATNADNPEGVRYSYDYTEQEPVSGLPLFPNLGVRGEL